MSSTAILPSILRGAAAVDDLLLGRLVERAQDVGVEAVLRVHRPQQRHHRELAALVDADGDAVLLRGVDLDPAAALGNHAAAVQPPLAGFHFGDEVDAGAAVQLAHHDALGAVDDELAAAEHDRQVAQVDFFLDRLLLVEPQPDAERPAVGQPQLPAFVRLVARLAELVAQVSKRELLVVALDREDFAQHAFQAFVLALVRAAFVLQEPRVALGLDLGQIRNRVRIRARCRSVAWWWFPNAVAP